MSIHDLPAYIPVTPPLADEGWPLPPGADDVVIRYRADGTIDGVDYVIGGGIASAPAAVEAGLWDVTARRFYDAWRRLRRLAFLCVGPIDEQGLEGVTTIGPAGTFAHLFGVPATQEAPGVTLTVDWTAFDPGPPLPGSIPIHNVDELQAMQGDLSADYHLANDIDASATAGWNDGVGFIPVGQSTSGAFAGTFDGRNHTVSGLTINRPLTWSSSVDTGLFRAIHASGAVKNAKMTGGSVTGYRAGALAGNNSGTITSCSADVPVLAALGAGGLVSDNSGSGTISYCYSSGDVEATLERAGGLVAANYGDIFRCFATGNVTAVHAGSNDSRRTGGLCGVNDGGVISDSFSTGNVDGREMVAGFVGANNQGSLVERCYSTGHVSGANGEESWKQAQGFIGHLHPVESPGTDVGCYWDVETSGCETSEGTATGKTTAEMQQQATFDGWDFDTVWAIDEGQSYPRLRDEGGEDSNAPIEQLMVRENPFSLGATYGTPVADALIPSGLAIHPTAAIGQIVDWEITSETTALITLNKAIDVSRMGGAYFCVESAPPVAPHIRLRDDPAGPWHPEADALTRFWFGRGAYLILAQLPDVYKVGRDDAESIGYLIGLPGTAQTPATLILDGAYTSKFYLHHGALKHRTGIVTDGIEAFDSFNDAQARLEEDSEPNTDNVGLLALINATAGEGRPVKQDPSGGASAGNRALLATAPGYHFERAVGMRRCGTQGFGQASAIGGAGERAVQRARRRLILSPAFEAATGTTEDAESIVQIFDPPIEIAGLPFFEPAAAAIWMVPGYCTDLDTRRERDKLTATIAALDATTPGQLAVEFDLEQRATIRVDAGTNYPENYDTGGNVVCPPLSWESRNIGSTSASGDRQRLLVPGDVVEAVWGMGAAIGRAVVLEAEAFGGATVAGATAPSAQAAGIPQSLRDNHAKRDRVIVSTVGPEGAKFADIADVGDPLSFAGQAAVAPVAYNVLSLQYQHDGGDWITVLPIDYYMDPIDGRIYFSDLAGLPLSGTLRLRADVWLFDRRIVYPCEVANVLHEAVDGACEGYTNIQADPSPGRALTLNGSTTWGVDGIGIDVYSESPIGGSDADGIGDVLGALVHDPDPLPGWTFVPSSSGGTQGVEGSASGFKCTNSFAFYANLFGIVPPVPRQWLAGEIAAAVCDLIIYEPALHTQDTQPIFPDPVTSFNGLRLAGYIIQHDAGTGAVLAIRDAAIGPPMTGLVYFPEEGETPAYLRGTVDVTAVMAGLAVTYAANETPFIAIVGPGGDASMVGMDPRALFASWFAEYQRDSTRNWDAYVDSSDKGNPYWIVQRIVHAGIVASNWRLRPDAAALAATRYAGDGAAL